LGFKILLRIDSSGENGGAGFANIGITHLKPVFIGVLLLLWLRKTINVLMFTFRRMPGKMFSNL
jgi:hypothetical protein